MKFYQTSIKEVVDYFQSKTNEGLTQQEANKRLVRDGYNEFEKSKKKSFLEKFIAQFKSFMIIVLIVAAIISGVTGVLNGEGITDAIIILSIIIVNALIGVFQESKAEKSLEALQKMSAHNCKVVRDGTVRIIASRELVVGDIVELETGDVVPADLRLIDSANLKTQEAALTGESLPVEKNIEPIEKDVLIGDMTNMVFSSSSVSYGRGKGIVVATGAQTEVGKIAAMLQNVQEEKTPMQERLDQLGKILAIVCIVVCVVIFVVGLLYGKGFMEMFMTAISLAVAAIPEGLPAVSTVVLSLGVQRLAKQRAIVKNLPSVETLGSTTVICSDKTGTLTQNVMTVTELFADGQPGQPGMKSESIDEIVKIMVLANDAQLSNDNKSIGDPTETALLDLGVKYGVHKNELIEKFKRVAEVPFDSERKRMTTINQIANGKYMVATKGGVDEILECCTHIAEYGKIRAITDEDIKNIKNANLTMAQQALRVLASASTILENVPDEVSPKTVEHDLVFFGMVGMIDPPREEAKVAVSQCKTAGIKPVMITGDHKITAKAIASALGICEGKDNIMTGAEVEKLNDDELDKVVSSTSVFARVAPEHKVRIVNSYKRNGNVVAMTGDGVNDAPALKLADIGVAMGITGTDVSKEAADVVLTDDNFATIVSAVQEGRRIYANLIKSIQFMLSTNIGEILLLFVATLCNMPTPLLPIQLLWINLVTDSLPALALSVDKAEKDIMQQKPIDPQQGILTKEFVSNIIFRSIIIGGLTIGAYSIGLNSSEDIGRTMAFAVLAFSQMFIIFSVRSGRHAFTHQLFTNGFLWGAIAIVIGLMLMVLLIPALQELFKVVNLTSTQWLLVAGFSIASLVLSELYKLIYNLIHKK
jgi:Ca2+-transporting ATPase